MAIDYIGPHFAQIIHQSLAEAVGEIHPTLSGAEQADIISGLLTRLTIEEAAHIYGESGRI